MPQPSASILSTDFDVPWVRIRGRIDQEDRVTWSPCLRTMRGPGTELLDAARTATDAVWVSCESGTREQLARADVPVRRRSREDPSVTFSVRLPYRAGTRTVVLGRGDRRLGALDVPAEPPRLQLLHPLRSADVVPGRPLTLHWRRLDDGPPATYYVRVTGDGEHYCRVAFGLTETQYELDVGALPGGERCRIEVMATNGYHTAVVGTPTFRLPPRPPVLLLDAVDGPVLSAWGFSPQSGPVASDAVVWLDDGHPTARGGDVDLRTWGPGRHRVAVTVTAPDGTRTRQDLGWYDGRTGLRRR